jgi:hypothetical protein
MVTLAHLPLEVFFLAAGLHGVLRPYKTAKFGEQLDAIGSKRAAQRVEPADWNVTLTRVVSLFTTLGGTVVVLLAFSSS